VSELQRWAERAGHTVVATYQDQGISGAKGRYKRPGLDSMLKGAVRREFDLVACWSTDRLGRSMRDLLNTLEELRTSGRGLYLHTQALDTTTPAGNAMLQISGVFAEFERPMIQARVNAGIARAKA
jgi:DNA invertase Pin-like site-specific DNA recombinase